MTGVGGEGYVLQQGEGRLAPTGHLPDAEPADRSFQEMVNDRARHFRVGLLQLSGLGGGAVSWLAGNGW
jgi:hypothetical protein